MASLAKVALGNDSLPNELKPRGETGLLLLEQVKGSGGPGYWPGLMVSGRILK
jgi:hypothetical protein